MTVTMTAQQLRDSGLLESSRRIPFTDVMIEATDKGLKTETRRPMKYRYDGSRGKCRYGDKPGTLLLVTGAHVFLNSEGRLETRGRYITEGMIPIYRVDWVKKEWPDMPMVARCNWRRPMFMPKWAPTRYLISRIIEPSILSDITEEQAIAEGVEVIERGDGRESEYTWLRRGQIFKTAVEAFEYGWNLIHGSRGLYFNKKTEVWRIGFERLVVL
jgi:hypothetical protein